MSNFGKEFIDFKISQIKQSSKLMKDAFRNIEKFDNGETPIDSQSDNTTNDNISENSLTDNHLVSDKVYNENTQSVNPNELVYLGDTDKQKRV